MSGKNAAEEDRFTELENALIVLLPFLVFLIIVIFVWCVFRHMQFLSMQSENGAASGADKLPETEMIENLKK